MRELGTEEIRIYRSPEETTAEEIAPMLRDLYRRHPDARFLAAWELQTLLWRLGYADELLDEGEIAAAAKVVWREFFVPMSGAA
ncbi:MAG: hypothetical protein CYG60_13315 [Actinobacteria bacterium]|nr:MAG: hypothetical protein CYG60_13315 [Actinomycetota bacterium]